MKKLVTSLATIVLLTGTIVNTTAWTTNHNSTIQEPKATTNETAQDIANKLKGKTIYLDFNYWNGKTITSDMTEFRNELVNQGLLTIGEAQYIYNGNLQSIGVIKTAKIWNGLVVDAKKDGKTVAQGNLTLNITNNFPEENASQIAAKIDNQTLNLKIKNWYGKDIADYADDLANLLVNVQLLSINETQYISWNSLIINTSKIYNASFNVFKNGIKASGSIKLNVTSSQETASDIAQKLKGKSLKLNWGKWKDRDVANFSQKLNQLLVEQNILNNNEVKYLSWNSFIIDEPGTFQIPLTVQKFGETAHVYDFTLNVQRSFLPDDQFNFVKNYDNQIFVGTAEGLYVSSDNGNTWVKNYYLHKYNVTNIWFASTNNYLVEIKNGVGSPTLYSTTDDGKHFEVAMQHETVNSVQVFHNISSTITEFIAINTTAGMIYSLDGGHTWKIDIHFATMNVKQVMVLNSKVSSTKTKKIAVVTDNSGLWISSPLSNSNFGFIDYPTNWTKVGVGALTSVYQAGNVTYLLSYKYGLWINNDLLTTSKFTRNASLSAVDIKKITVFKNQVYAATTQGLWDSSDQGTTWQVIYSPIGTSNYDVTFLENAYDHLWVYSNDIGFWESFQSASGAIYFRVNQTVVGEPTALARANNGLIIVGTKTNGIYESGDNGQSFYPNISAEDLTNVTGGIKVINRNIYVGGANGLYMSENNGRTFYHED